MLPLIKLDVIFESILTSEQSEICHNRQSYRGRIVGYRVLIAINEQIVLMPTSGGIWLRVAVT